MITEYPLRDAIYSVKNSSAFGTVYYLPGQDSAQRSELICPTAYRKTQNTTRRWYRTVYIPLSVFSYDTHKDTRWLNSNPQTTEPTSSDTVIHAVAHRASESHARHTVISTITQIWLICQFHFWATSESACDLSITSLLKNETKATIS